ncbi:MAG: PKD domain-containing protein [Bacteroidia bacterium]|nr:PKD domain-containing protein [Bacteroidia bacterium]
MVVKIRKVLLLLTLLITLLPFSKAQLIINEVSQGPTGSKEFVELLVVGTATCSSIPCMDLRGYYIDDNNGNHATGVGTGIAQGSIRFKSTAFWSCIPIGTLIVIYNDADINASIPSDDISMSDGNCKLVFPISNCTLLEENVSLPSTTTATYPTTGFSACGSWGSLAMANGDDSFQTISPSGNEVFSVSWGNNTTNSDIYFSGPSSAMVAYMTNSVNNVPSNQANWARVSTSGNQTPGSANNAANAAWISAMNNSCTALTPLVLNSSSIDPSCTCDGTATVVASGANAPYTYSWAPSGGTAATASGLCAGTYTVTVTSSNGCTQTATETLVASSGLTVTVNSQTICAGQNAILTASGGTTYSWSTGATASSITKSPTTTTSYTVTGTSGGCSGTAIATVTVSGPLAITVNSETICTGQSATLTASGGTTYLWSTGATSNSITESPATTTSYTITGTSGGCSGTAVATVTVGAALAITVNSETICTGQSATLTAAGGTTYLWSNGSTASSITESPSATTSYTVTGTSGGCSGTAVATITVGSALAVTVNSETICAGQSAALSAFGGTTYLWSTGATTFSITESPATTTTYTVTGTSGGCSGTAVATVTVGGALPIIVNSETICTGQSATLSATGGTSYLWSTGATANSITESPSATTSYTVTWTSGGCSGTAVATVTVGGALAITVNSETICTGQSATLSASGGTTYLWSTGAATNSITESPTATTSYTVTGTSGGCSGTAVATITVGNNLAITVNSTSICAGQTATLTVSGATTYLWSTGSTDNSITDTPLTTTSYTVTGTSGGCSGNTIAIVTVGDALAISVNSATICSGETATLSASGAVTYLWSNGSDTDLITDTPTTTTSYTVTGTSGGCLGSAIATVTVNALPEIVFNADIISGCEPFCVTFTDASNSIGSNITSWNWDFGDGGISVDQHPQHCFDIQGQYSITLAIATSNGCSATFTNVNLITLDPFPVAQFTAPLSVGILEANISFTDNSTGASSWSWDFGDAQDTLNNASSLTDPSHAYAEAGTYCVTLAISNNAGCVDTNQLCFVINPEITFYIPNSFSPNGDGINDEFYVKGENIFEFEMSIYDRWGDRIFATKDINERWNGKANKGTKIALQDVYVYVVTFTDNKNESYHYTGNVTIVR